MSKITKAKIRNSLFIINIMLKYFKKIFSPAIILTWQWHCKCHSQLFSVLLVFCDKSAEVCVQRLSSLVLWCGHSLVGKWWPRHHHSTCYIQTLTLTFVSLSLAQNAVVNHDVSPACFGVWSLNWDIYFIFEFRRVRRGLRNDIHCYPFEDRTPGNVRRLCSRSGGLIKVL